MNKAFIQEIMNLIENKRKEIGMSKSEFLEKAYFKREDSIRFNPSYDFYLTGQRTPPLDRIEDMAKAVGLNPSFIIQIIEGKNE